MELTKLAVLDFETEKIQARPQYPPKPVGLALYVPKERVKKYYAWGHPEGNNSTKDEARRHVEQLRRLGYVFIMHHAGFDLDVGEVHLQLSWPTEHHDTLVLAFQDNPRAESFELKPLAEKRLGEPPTERDELKEWILRNVPDAKRSPSKWGAHISKAPGTLVGRYAIGDVTRAYGLFQLFVKSVLGDPQQRRAYERERKLTKVLIKMERRGIPVAERRLKQDIPKYTKTLRQVELDLMNRLKVPKRDRDEFTWTGEAFADCLERAGVVKEWIMTKPSKTHPHGQRRTGVDSLHEVGVEKSLVDELEVRAQLQTCLNTFMGPWLEQAQANGGYFYARFNQVRQPSFVDGRKLVGTETGRLSMTPNLQNVIRSDKNERVPPVRDYVVPGRELRCLKPTRANKTSGLMLIQRDYSQQELRILAHEEGGSFLAQYQRDPTIDAHTLVQQMIRQLVGLDLPRRSVKDLNFGLIYGMGVAKLALKIGLPTNETRKLHKAHVAALPDVKIFKDSLKVKAEANEPVYTWGGRKYYVEPARIVEGRLWDFWYKLLNLIVQGGAADCTKQAMVNYNEAGYDDMFPLILQVHDELLTLAPAGLEKKAHHYLNAAMLDVDFKVPMLSDGKVGKISWHRMKKVDYA